MTSTATPDTEARAATVIAGHVQRVVADAPPLTDAQRDRLTGLLRAGDAR